MVYVVKYNKSLSFLITKMSLIALDRRRLLFKLTYLKQIYLPLYNNVHAYVNAANTYSVK